MEQGRISLDISGESAHEKALLEMHRDLLDRECDETTAEGQRVRNIAALETHSSALNISCDFSKVSGKDDDSRRKQDSLFRKAKGKVLSEIIKKLDAASKERYEIAKSSFELGSILGGVPDDADG